MILQRKRGLHAVLLLLQCVLLALSFTLCLLGTSLFTTLSWEQVIHYPTYTLVMMAGLIAESNRRDLASKQFSPFGNNLYRQHAVSFQQTLYAMGALFIYLVIVRDTYVSRISLALWVPVLYLILLWSNRYLWWMLASSLFSGVRKGRILLVGDPPKAFHLRSWLNSKEVFGMDTLGILCDQPLDPSLEMPKRLGRIEDAERVIREYGITQIILLQLPEAPEQHTKMMAAMERHGVRLLIFNNLEEKLKHPVIYLEDDGHPLHLAAAGAAGESAEPDREANAGYCRVSAGCADGFTDYLDFRVGGAAAFIRRVRFSSSRCGRGSRTINS